MSEKLTPEEALQKINDYMNQDVQESWTEERGFRWIVDLVERV